MEIYRVTELIRGKSKNNKPFRVYASAYLGTMFHEKMKEFLQSSNRGKGKYIEKTISIFGVSSAKTIKSQILGTPDLFWFHGDTLHITDWKTATAKSYKSNLTYWWNQVFFYAYMILLNYPRQINKIKFKIEVFQRLETFAEILKNPITVLERECLTSEISTNLPKYIKSKITSYYFVGSPAITIKQKN